MPSLLLNCVLFTLKDRKVRDNEYVTIFYTWLSKLIQNGGLDKADKLVITIDERTIEYFKRLPGCLGVLLSKLQCPYVFKILPAPTTMLEGMKMRYHAYNFEQDAYMYCDIDVIIMKSLKTIISQTKPGRIYTCIEGKLDDPNYGADTPAIKHPHYIELGGVGLGYTSGIFIVTATAFLEALFYRVHKYYRDAGYYALDQPFFNRAVHELPHDASLLWKHVTFNGQNYNKDTCVLFNCAGDVGNGFKHHEKIKDVLMMIDAGVF